MKRILVPLTAAAVGLTLALTACSSSSSSKSSSSSSGAAASAESVTIGSADFPESELLADIYGDALAAKGVKVSKKLNIGERSVYWTAMKDGSINYFPEYNGSILYYLDTKATAKSPADVNTALQTALTPLNLVALTSASAQDSDSITVTKATATKYNLTSIGDLAPVASKLTLGAPAAFQTRADGVPALASVYGVTFGTFTPLPAGGTATVSSLKNGNGRRCGHLHHRPVDRGERLRHAQGRQEHVRGPADHPDRGQGEGQTQTDHHTSNAVSAKLDTVTLAALVAKVSGANADSVAKDWLSSVGLG